MSEPFLGEIRLMGFNFPPRGWAACNGQLLPINQNQSLYSLLGTNYGGDGETSFALPDLRGRTPMHRSTSHPIGEKEGTETETLSSTQMPLHSHALSASNAAATSPFPDNTRLLGNSAPGEFYAEPEALVPMHAGTISSVGANNGHDNMQPFLTVQFCIAVQGIFPSRT